MGGDVENGDFSGVHDFMNVHNLYHQGGLKPPINSNIRDNNDMNDDLNNGHMSHGSGLIDSHTLSQFN